MSMMSMVNHVDDDDGMVATTSLAPVRGTKEPVTCFN
jgi:hypothetical protein